MIDYWKLTRNFSVGDTVQKVNLSEGALSPYVGHVVQVSLGLGVLEVQWPFGTEQAYPDDLVRVNPKFFGFLPPGLNQSYPTVGGRGSKTASLWSSDLPTPFYMHLAKSWHNGVSSVIAYDDWYRANPKSNDALVRSETEKFYRLGVRASDLRLAAVAHKTAAYWVAQNRQYRATSTDLKAGKPSCPKCSSSMRRTTYRMEEGSKHKVFACPKCLTIIDPSSILGPAGEPHDWFGTGGL